MLHQRESLPCRYHYDPLDRLIGQRLAATPERQRFYCKKRLVTEIQGAMSQTIFQTDDVLLAQQRREGDAFNSTLLVTDQQQSVLQSVGKKQQQNSIAYSPYGHRPAEIGLTSLLGFNGEPPDSVTGHYLLGNGYRAFNPVLMRFNSPDSWSPFGKSCLNAYAYCLGDPVNATDTSGHSPIFTPLLKSLFSRVSNPDSRLATARFGHRPFPVRQRRPSDPGPSIPSLLEPDFLGLHGASIEGAANLLKKGVLPNHSQVTDRPGFYFSPDRSVAVEYAERAHWKSTKRELTRFGKEHIVEVHIQNFQRMTPGVDYEFNPYMFDHNNLGHMTMEFIVKEHRLRAVEIRTLGSTSLTKKVRPRSFEAPF